ncbi:hypothetical protein XELAEV_18025832mg [Xenopus laevis]|uniref:Uncharacterized protein n=1 Tax=Xenopus laevis TaxID=8355 RepID=A0A974D324_XENLA|nr:hypothetical protein XELAEV_18025832mg [Xenopus laevis]
MVVNEWRILNDVLPNFVWTMKYIQSELLQEYQMYNHYDNDECFTTKAQCIDGVATESYFPRCYLTEAEEQRNAFIEDFLITAARSIVKSVVNRNGTSSLKITKRSVRDDMCMSGAEGIRHSAVGADIIKSAIKACEIYLANKQSDMELQLSSIRSINWMEFLESYYQIIHEGAYIEKSEKYDERCRCLLHKLEAVMPQLDIEGERNVWIIKPGSSTRGADIICKDRLEEILDFVSDNQCRHWVVQKYIERPLLILGAKFDLRQWFLITNWEPLTIWFYKESYIRFSSQPFTLENLDISIHLCNNAIQRNYKISESRHPDLPIENRWTNRQLQAHLERIGASDAWEKVMVPGMKTAIIQTMMVSQRIVYNRTNSFDLYGADIMFDEKFKPWLIEINYKPDLYPPPSVATQLCNQVQEDTLRVVLDRRDDPNCDIGAYELIYEQVSMI